MTAFGAGAEAPATLSQRWYGIAWPWRVLIAALTAIVVVQFALSFVGNLYSAPSSSPTGSASSESAAPSGTQALAVLLSDRHHPVQQVTVPLTQANLPAGATLFVLDPASSMTAEASTLANFVRNGGHLVLSGDPSHALLSSLLGPGTPLPVWTGTPAGPSSPVASEPEVAGVTTVTSDLAGSWADSTASPNAGGEITVLLQGTQTALALLARVGTGTVVLLASSGPLQNQFLASADNAAFGLDLAGSTAGPAIFDEWDHGLGRAGTGLAGLPAHWQMGLGLVLAAALVWVLSAARRFGPAQHAEREFIPARVAHVDAMASLLAAGDPERRAAGAAPLRQQGRATLERVLRAPPDSSDESLVEMAAQSDLASVTAEQAAALLSTPRSADDLVKLGAAFTALEHGRGR